MNLTQEIIKLAKVIHDAKIEECYFKPEWERIKKRFPGDLTPRSYTVPQPWIDDAIAQAKAVIKYLGEKDVEL